MIAPSNGLHNLGDQLTIAFAYQRVGYRVAVTESPAESASINHLRAPLNY